MRTGDSTAGSGRRIGVFGGAFDPVHFGHLLLAEQCMLDCALDEVLFVPTSIPPHRESALAPAEHRIAMLELAVEPRAGFQVSRAELDRAGVSYTVDTLEQLHVDHPDDELLLLLAETWLPKLTSWRRLSCIAELATIVAVNRAGAVDLTREQLADALPAEVRDRVVGVRMPAVELSSTEIRRRLAAQTSIRFLTPDPVVDYIERHGLYAVT